MIIINGEDINNNFLLLALTAIFNDNPATKNDVRKKRTVIKKSIDLLRKAQCLNESLVSLIKQSDIDQALNSVMVKSLNSI